MPYLVDGEALKADFEEILDSYLYKAEIKNNPTGHLAGLAACVSDLIDRKILEAQREQEHPDILTDNLRKAGEEDE